MLVSSIGRNSVSVELCRWYPLDRAAFFKVHRLELSLFISLLFVFFFNLSFLILLPVDEMFCTFPCMQDSPFYSLLLCMYPSRCAPSLLCSLPPVVCVFVWPKNISPNSELLERTVPSIPFLYLSVIRSSLSCTCHTKPLRVSHGLSILCNQQS